MERNLQAPLQIARREAGIVLHNPEWGVTLFRTPYEATGHTAWALHVPSRLPGGLPGFLREPLQGREGDRGVGGRPERRQCGAQESPVPLGGEP